MKLAEIPEQYIRGSNDRSFGTTFQYTPAGENAMSDLNTKLTQIANLATNIDAYVCRASDEQLLKTDARALKLYRYFATRFGTATTLQDLAKIGSACLVERQRRSRNALLSADARRCLAAR
jgi:hypothetical protein